MNAILVLLFGLSTFAFAQSQSNLFSIFHETPNAVIQGERVSALEPIAGSVVKIRMNGGSCTGSAIASNVVITAAHCQDLGGEIRFVHHMAGTGLECGVAEVEEVAYAPGAERGPSGSHLPDILLVKLKTPLCGVSPAKLRYEQLSVGEIVRAAGYGQGTVTEDRPDRVDLRVINPEELREAYREVIQLKPEMAEVIDYFVNVVPNFYTLALPAKNQTSLCNGDSGGPVYQEVDGFTRLIGINGAIAPHEGRGTSLCKFGYIQMFTPVAPYLGWIESKLQEWGN